MYFIIRLLSAKVESEREMELHTVNFDVLLNFIRGYSFNEDTFAKPRPACAVADCIV
jgi:hypothetical protein